MRIIYNVYIQYIINASLTVIHIKKCTYTHAHILIYVNI